MCFKGKNAHVSKLHHMNNRKTDIRKQECLENIAQSETNLTNLYSCYKNYHYHEFFFQILIVQKSHT